MAKDLYLKARPNMIVYSAALPKDGVDGAGLTPRGAIYVAGTTVWMNGGSQTHPIWREWGTALLCGPA